jgi:hypothetical protein
MGAPPEGIKLLAPLAVGNNQDGRMEVCALGISGSGSGSTIQPWHRWQVAPSNGWSGWRMLGSLPNRSLERLVIGRNHDGRLEVFGHASEDSAAWHIWQRKP